MANKVVALFVEGPTEIEFYKAVIKHIHDQMNIPFSCEFEWIDMHGIGNYKNDALRKYNFIRKKHEGKDVFPILCIETDVFELTKKPPIDKAAVKASLLEAGAPEVVFVEAKHSIEDWFLTDFEGVISYLRLPRDTKRPPGKGQTALKALFVRAKKVYVKGSRTEGFISKLNIPQILLAHCKAFRPLCRIVGVDCKTVCKKN